MTIQKILLKSFIKTDPAGLFLLLLISFSLQPLFSEDFVFNPSPSSVYKKRTIYNLRIRENNNYKGSVYREERERYTLESEDGALKTYSGSAFVFEELKNEGRDRAKKIDDIIEGSFILFPDGSMKRKNSTSFPFITGFPAYPASTSSTSSTKTIKAGDVWTSTGDILVDPLKKGIYTKVGFICAYRYDGLTTSAHIAGQKDTAVHQVSAQYAVRYKKGDDPGGDRDLEEISGSHRAVLYLTAEHSLPFFIQDNIDEVYKYAALSYSRKGFSHTWYTDVVPMERGSVKDEITKAVRESGLESEGAVVEETNEGVSLTVNKIHFVPDKAELLPGEDRKIALIASVLDRIKDRSFFVTGHTADIGTAESQLELSIKRAETIAAMLGRLGIAPERLIFTGKGGTEPASDNSTEEGRALNRRVEIIILED